MKRRVLLGVIVVAVIAATGIGIAARDDGAPAGGGSLPASIAADCSRDVDVELSRFINGLPDGSTVRFAAGGCYAQSARIEVLDKRKLTIDGNGATFKSTAPNSGLRADSNWLILRGDGVRITDMNIVGNFHLKGARSLRRVNEVTVTGAGSQFNHGVGVYGGKDIYITDMTITGVFGDGVSVGVGHYIAGSPADPLEAPRNIHVERVKVRKAARHCYSPNQAVGFWLEDSAGDDCWYGGLDAELDNVDQQLQNIHVLRNTFSNFNQFGILFPVVGNGTNTKDIEIKDNVFSTFPDQPCNTVIEVGTYPTNPNILTNVTVTGNVLKTHGVGIAFDHVQNSRIRDNRIEYKETNCPQPGAVNSVRVTNGLGVTVENNVRRP